jgi:hypothetical protein
MFLLDNAIVGLTPNACDWEPKLYFINKETRRSTKMRNFKNSFLLAHLDIGINSRKKIAYLD